jgi:PHD/YefM family antitoxin component YafN of YafNO toxin-antitoxin module
MKIYNYSEARQQFSTVLNTALKEEVIITRKDGSRFKLISMDENKEEEKSPLENIKGIKTNITMKDILEAIKQGREEREYIKKLVKSQKTSHNRAVYASSPSAPRGSVSLGRLKAPTLHFTQSFYRAIKTFVYSRNVKRNFLAKYVKKQ